MPDVTAKRREDMSQTAEMRKLSEDHEQSRPALDTCYGQIGISAVAAAAKYQGTAKNSAYAPASTDWRAQFAE